MPSIFTLSPRSLLRRVSARSIIDEIKAAFNSTTTSEHDVAESDLPIHPQGITVNLAPVPDNTPAQPKPRPRVFDHPVKPALLTRINPKTFDDRLSATTIFARTDSRSTLPSQTRLRRDLRKEREHHFFQTWSDMSDISSEADTICEANTDGEWDASGVDTAATTPVSLKVVLRQAPGPVFDRPALKRASTTPVSLEVGERQAPGPAGPFFEVPALKRAPTTPVSLEVGERQAPGPAGPFLETPALKRKPALRRKRSSPQLRGEGEGGGLCE